MGNFCITFALETELFQDDTLSKRFEIGRKIYNALVNVTQKRYNEVIKTNQYRNIKLELYKLYNSTSKDKLKQQKALYNKLNDMYKHARLNEYLFHEDVKQMQHHFKNNIDSFTAQKIATILWKSYEKLLYGEGKSVHYKRYDSLNSLEGKSNKTGIRFKNNSLIWNGLKIPVKIDYNNLYEYQVIQNEICYCRITRKFVRDKYKYYLQLVLKGNPPTKIDKETGEIKRQIGTGNVGLDVGTQTLAISSNTDVRLLELADRVQNIEKQKCVLLRYMDRSKRANNPDNYNEDGTIKKQGNKKVKWVRSNRYNKAKNKLKETYRKQADIRKLQHEKLANYIISLGDNIKVETMNYKGLQARAKKTTINEETGKINKKKRFGKSLANKAPAMLIEIINRKLHYFNKEIVKINTWSVKASQYNHFSGECNKKQLSERWNDFNGLKIQRDLYSAFLIQNVNDDMCTINDKMCNDNFGNFMLLHNDEVNKLKSCNLTNALKNVI
jgi:hypothetical protein